MGDLALIIPEATVLLGAVVALVLSVLGTPYRLTWRISVVMAIAGLAASIAWLGKSGEPFFPGIYNVDAFSQVLKVGITAGLFLSILIAGRPESVRERSRIDLPLFLFFSTVGMMMVVSATELVTLYVALELSAYGLYILAALSKRHREGSEAAAKYVLFGAASSAVTLFGISLVFGAARTTLLADIAAQPATPMLVVGVLLAIAGLLFKLAVFPFHAWAPDTYQGGPHESITFIGTASKVAAVGVLARLLSLATPAPEALVTVLLILCVASMTVGNLAAIVQNDIKRFLAYSTVAQAGYILIGLACWSQMGVASAIYYTVIYVPIVFCAFLVVCVLGADGSNPTKTTIAGLYGRSPLLAVALLVSMFGLAGIPPTSGFLGKWFLFSAAVQADLLWLVVVGAINATVSLYYYLRIIKEAYLTPPADDTAITVAPATAIAAWLGIALVIFFGFYPRPLWELAEAAAKIIG
ncbi:MAG: NADH-quinone oxidoreductase subunit N [Planctomycetota bacterium]|jgi:NADH-quinone oxidoreductase subunit N